jgi:sarcosine oxidase subunit gamma
MTEARPVLTDLEKHSRLGVRGRETLRWSQANHYQAPAACNQAAVQENGSLIARLSTTELLWLDNPRAAVSQPHGSMEEDHLCYTIARRDSHAWFEIAGRNAPRLFARLCGADLSSEAFANLAVAQTIAGGISAIIIRADNDNSPTYNLLTDSSYRNYLWKLIVAVASGLDTE